VCERRVTRRATTTERQRRAAGGDAGDDGGGDGDGDGGGGETRGGDGGDDGGEASGGSVATTGEGGASGGGSGAATGDGDGSEGGRGETTEGRAREAQDWRPEEGHTASIRKQGPCVGAAWRGAPAHPRITGLPGTLARATRSRRPLSIFASTCSCAPRVFRRASQGPQGRVVSFGGARRGPDRRLRAAVQQRRPGRVPRFIGAYSSSPHTVPLCLGVRGPGIAELRSVVSRVAS
jgi:hypothetical protein